VPNFIPGHLSACYAAEFNLAWLTGWQVDLSRDNNDISVIGGGSSRAYQAGLGGGSIAVNGFWEDGAGNSEVQVAALLDGTYHPFTAAPQGGATIGNRAYLLDVQVTDSPISATPDGTVELSTGRQGSGAAAGGIILKDYAAETSTGNFTGIDDGALSSLGAVGHLHVTAFDGTDATIKITDSVDEGVYADLITFTEATDVTSERVAATGTVNRWTRVELTGTFTSITFTVGFARLLQ
jgi:hypothetical protein